MSKYVIKYSYDKKDKRWVCGTNELFGFFLYADTEEQLKKSCIKTLKVFTGNKDLTGKDVEFISVDKTFAIEMEM